MSSAAAAAAGRVALITGASSGIGAATAVAFARHGYRLSLAGRNERRLAETARRCVEASSASSTATASTKEPPLTTVGDVANSTDLAALADATRHQFGGRLDALVNNAGVLELGSIEATDLAQFDRVIGVNLRSIYHLTKLCLPMLKATGPPAGCIVNVSSVNGQRAFPGLLAYNVSKAGLDQLTRCLALELAPSGVRCNAVSPGVIVTSLQRTGGLTEAQYQQFLERAAETHALGRPGQPEEAAEAALFLADPARSGFITGVTLPVDGGRHAMCPR